MNQPTPDWYTQALCAGPEYEEQRDLWFPHPTDTASINAAKSVCWSCPVIQSCAKWAFAHHEDRGIWAGLTEGERRKLHRRRARKTGGTSGHTGVRRRTAA